MEDGYYHDTVEFLQHSLETISDNLVYGFDNINNLIKEYDPIKLPILFVKAEQHDVSDRDTGSGGGGESGEC